MRAAIRETLQIVVLALIIFLILHLMVQNFRIEGTSMEANLHDHQYVLVNKTAYWFGSNPTRGDIIVFEAPDQPDFDRIKRVIGLPGETVEVKGDGTVYITFAGETTSTILKEPYISYIGGKSGTWVVPQDHYFVMGDNRGRSYDSRSGGAVPKGNIIGKAWLIIWPINDWGTAPNFSLMPGDTSQE
ncbi:MAG: signal peptidase I [Chloroflexota bacterium]|nr:signal peptidase I [Chloroflexota bacterium]